MFPRWPVLRQIAGRDRLGLGAAAISDHTEHLRPRTETAAGKPLRRSLGLAVLGGATLDSEENYLMKKFFSAAGAVSIENQARI